MRTGQQAPRDQGRAANEKDDITRTLVRNQGSSITFLERKYTPEEYHEICSNLSEYFRILRAWANSEKTQS